MAMSLRGSLRLLGAPSPSASSAASFASASASLAFAAMPLPPASPIVAARLWAEWLMITFGRRPGRKILPGRLGRRRLLPAPCRRRDRVNGLISLTFGFWHGICTDAAGRAAWEGGSNNRCGPAWEGLGPRPHGEHTDAERTSHRPVAADVLAARHGGGRQQHREHRHQRLQGGFFAVRGIPHAGGPRRHLPKS